MPETPQGVTPDSPPGQDVPSDAQGAASSPVTDVTPSADDRPIQNVKAEFDRKLSKVERQLAEIAAMLAAQQSQRPAVPEPVAPVYTDQQLAELAAAGNVAAQQELITRQVDQRVQEQAARWQAQQEVVAQLQALYARFPMLTDASHPLTQAALQAKALLVRRGSAPQSPVTDLEAIKLAIVDHPELAQPVATPPASTGFRGWSAPQAAVDAAAPRRAAPQTPTARAITQKEKDVARRMGVSDPAAAIKRFDQRQQEGRSSFVSPLVAQIVREEPGA